MPMGRKICDMAKALLVLAIIVIWCGAAYALVAYVCEMVSPWPVLETLAAIIGYAAVVLFAPELMDALLEQLNVWQLDRREA